MYLLSPATYLWDLYRVRYPLVITRRLIPAGAFTRLIPAGAFRGWCAVRTLQIYFSNRL